MSAPRAGLCALLAMALVAAAPSRPHRDGELALPAAAHALAGLHGVKTTSRIRLAAAPDDPHELQVILAFPDRQRWTLRSEARQHLRRIEYRFGEHAFALPPGEAGAARMPEEAAIVGASRAAFLRRCALRQAAFLWPEGAAWTGDGATRTAPVLATARATADDGPEPAALGDLLVELDDAGRPVAFSSRDADGALEEELAITAWSTVGGREWPARLHLSVAGAPVWDEEVLSVAPTVRFRDRVFVPESHASLLRAFARPLPLRLPAAATRRSALDPGSTWTDALDQARAEHRAATDIGLELFTSPWLELNSEGEPTAVLLRLAASQHAPDGWSPGPAAEAIAIELDGLDAPGPKDRERVRAAIPEGRSLAGWTARVGERGIRLQAALK